MRDGRFRRAYIGIAGGPRPVPPRLAGRLGRRNAVEVVEVVEGSPAINAVLMPDDLIVAVDGKPVASAGDLQGLMTEERIGRALTMTVVRQGAPIEVDVVPEELDE
jgi:S1-C subfamily serine protease